MSVETVTDSTFEAEVLKSDKPVLVDFHADWCAPCKQLSPIVADVAKELAGKLKVVKLDVDANPMVARSFRVQSIPMLVVIHQGQIADMRNGLVDKKTILDMVQPFLTSDASEVLPQQLLELVTAKRALAVDVRDGASYARYRIPGAVNIPAEEVLGRAAEVKANDGRVRVLYGRSTDEARDLAEKLREQGVQVGFLNGGFLHWESDGLDVERGA